MAGRWFSPGNPVSSTNKADCHDIAEILLKVALNTITLNPIFIMLQQTICTFPTLIKKLYALPELFPFKAGKVSKFSAILWQEPHDNDVCNVLDQHAISLKQNNSLYEEDMFSLNIFYFPIK